MPARRMLHTLVITFGALALAVAVAAQPTPGMSPEHAPGAAGKPPGFRPMGPVDMPKTMELTDAQVKGFIAAVGELNKLNPKIAHSLGADIGNPKSTAGAAPLSSEAQAILKKNGFESAEQFQQVGYNAALALGVLDQGGKAAMKKKAEEAEHEQTKILERMRQHSAPSSTRRCRSKSAAPWR